MLPCLAPHSTPGTHCIVGWEVPKAEEKRNISDYCKCYTMLHIEKAMDLTAQGPIPGRRKIVLSKTSSLALGPTQPLIHSTRLLVALQGPLQEEQSVLLENTSVQNCGIC